MGVNVLALTVSIYMLQVMDRVIMSRSLETLFFLTLLALAALVTFGILDWSRNRVMNRLAQWLEDRLSGPLARLRLYNSLHLPGVGQDPVQDLRHVSATMVSPAFLALFDSPWAPLYLGLIFLLHPALGWLALAGMIILVIIAAVGDYLTRNRHKDIQQAVSQSSGLLGLYGSNADSLGAMGMTDRLLNRWQGRHGAATAAAQRTADSSAAITALTKTARLMLQIGILGLGAYLAVLDELTPGAMIAASIILSRALAPVEQSVGSWRNLSNAWHSANRLYTLLKTAPLDAQTLPVEPENGTVAVSNLYYRAHNTPDPILTGLTWSIAQGTHLAILGRSGSGKSTLARLLVGTLKSLNGSIEIAGLDPLTA
ncbi:MAG: ATP-binding cassette domain-containing protein, partial [Rhodospirillaceae bacterium]